MQKTEDNEKNNNIKKNSTNSFKPVAVLELFTSQGCSSCPPADKLLPQLARLDSNIFILSYHVDYWNYLGWKDPFSKAIFTDRQNEYARHLKLKSIYTPQLVINGKYELVGSNRIIAESRIRKSLDQNAAVLITVQQLKSNGNEILMSYELKGNWEGTHVVAALVQIEVAMSIKAGENEGSKLTHYNVVRSFSKELAGEKGTIRLDKIKDLNDKEWQVIIFAQNKNDMQIIGGTLYDPHQ